MMCTADIHMPEKSLCNCQVHDQDSRFAFCQLFIILTTQTALVTQFVQGLFKQNIFHGTQNMHISQVKQKKNKNKEKNLRKHLNQRYFLSPILLPNS